MAVLSDDFLALELDTRERLGVWRLEQLGITEWPPPERIIALGGLWKRVSYSQLTDEQSAGMSHVARGALYNPVEDLVEYIDANAHINPVDTDRLI